jgi:hypothetical protein
MVVGHIQTNRGSQGSTSLGLFDIEKAFNSVWHEGLLQILMKITYILQKL